MIAPTLLSPCLSQSVSIRYCCHICLLVKPLSQVLTMHRLNKVEQWAVGLYVRALTIGIVQDQELLRLEKESATLNQTIHYLRDERYRHLEDVEEVD